MSELLKIRAMLEETKTQRLAHRRAGRNGRAGNSDQTFAAACAIREQALIDVLDVLTGTTTNRYSFGPD